MEQIEVGYLVKSLKGRDAGRVFCVISKVDEQYVFIADGKYRRLGNPKLKKIKHLSKVGVITESIVNKFLSGSVVFDGELKKAINTAIGGNKAD